MKIQAKYLEVAVRGTESQNLRGILDTNLLTKNKNEKPLTLQRNILGSVRLNDSAKVTTSLWKIQD